MFQEFLKKIDNNGSRKMIVCYTDRLIRIYGWSNATAKTLANTNTLEPETIVFENSWELPDQVMKYFNNSTVNP